MHYLEATFRTAIENKGFRKPIDTKHYATVIGITFQVCRNGYNLAKDLYNLGLHKITRYKDHERFFVVIEFCSEPRV